MLTGPVSGPRVAHQCPPCNISCRPTSGTSARHSPRPASRPPPSSSVRLSADADPPSDHASTHVPPHLTLATPFSAYRCAQFFTRPRLWRANAASSSLLQSTMVSPAVRATAAKTRSHLRRMLGGKRITDVTLSKLEVLLDLVEQFAAATHTINFHLHLSGYDMEGKMFWAQVVLDSPARRVLYLVYRGEHWYRGIASISVACLDFGHTYVYGP